MVYRLTISANFPSKPPPGWLAAIKQLIELNAITINPDTNYPEPSYYEVHKCFHDEQPTEPCQSIDNWTSS